MRRLDSTRTGRETECRPAGKRRMELPLNDNFCFADQNRKPLLVGTIRFGDGGEGQPTGIEWQQANVRRSSRSGLIRWGGHGGRQQDGTWRPTTTSAHTITGAAIIVFFLGIFRGSSTCYLRHCFLECWLSCVYPSWGTPPAIFRDGRGSCTAQRVR